MHPDTKQAIILRDSRQIAASLKPLLGFNPSDSFVIILTRSGVVQVTMRSDLPDDWCSAASFVVSTAKRIGVDGAVLAVYLESRQDDQKVRARINEVAAELEITGIQVVDALLIKSGRYWSLFDDGIGAQGALWLPEDSPLPQPSGMSRDELVARYAVRAELTPPNAVYAIAKQHLLGGRHAQVGRVLEALLHLSNFRNGQHCHASDLLHAIVHVAVQDSGIRDFLLGALVRVDNRQQLAEVLAEVALTATPDLQPRICGLAAAALAATSASTVPASCLASLAEDDALGQLVSNAISSGIHPEAIRRAFIDAQPPTQNPIENEVEPDVEI